MFKSQTVSPPPGAAAVAVAPGAAAAAVETVAVYRVD